MSHSATSTYTFASCADRLLEATFDGGRLTTDGGLPWLSEADAELGLCAALAACLTEWRKDPARSRHSLENLVRQRLFQLACGQLPLTGHDLASQPTLSRLENSVDRQACRRLAYALARL